MKKKLFSIMALLLTAGTAMAQNENALGVADITLPQNGEATLTVSFQFDVADSYTGYSFNLELPSELEFVMEEGTDVACTKGSCHDATHSVTANLNEGLVKVAGLSVSSKPLKGTEGVLLTFTIKPASEQVVGKTFTGNIKDILIVPVEGTKQKLADGQFTVTIGEPADTRTLLSETSTTIPEAGTGVDVRVRRTIKANEWSTLCLPFAMSAEQVKAAFGEDVELADFAGYDITEEDEIITAITVNFNDLTAIEANHPCLIKVSEPVEEFTVDGVDIDPEDEPVVATVKRTRKQWSELVGTYVANTEVPEKTLFLNGNKFWYSAGATKMKAFRAYFDFYDVLTEVDEAYAKVRFIVNGESTAIEGIASENYGADNKVYSVSGVYMGTADKLNSLPAGMYIVNGTKVMVK